MTSQQCRVCKVEKTFDQFVYANRGARLTSMCKQCNAARSSIYYYGKVRPNKCDLEGIAKSQRDKIAREKAKAAGLPRYKSEVSCPAGHVGQRSVHGGSCCKCARDKRLSEVSYSSKRHGVKRTTADNLGKTHYFTGIACKRGHISNRLVSTRQCVECLAERPARKKKFVASEVAQRRTTARRRNRVGRAKSREYYRRMLKGKSSHRLTQFARAYMGELWLLAYRSHSSNSSNAGCGRIRTESN